MKKRQNVYVDPLSKHITLFYIKFETPLIGEKIIYLDNFSKVLPKLTINGEINKEDQKFD